jgi:aldose 1-epimerase
VSAAAPPIARELYGRLADGSAVDRFVLSNTCGTRVEIIPYGGIITAIEVADRHGERRNVVLGCPTLDGYVADRSSLGATIGRYANRIAEARFEIDGQRYQLARNNGRHALHGGPTGFGRRLWQPEIADGTLRLSYRSADGEEGYPGTLEVSVRFGLDEDDALAIDYAASTDAPTVLNLTNHSYFNLAGEGARDIGAHELTLFADAFLPVTEALVPTGEIRPVEGTPFDFRAPTMIGARIDATDEQLLRAGGYDHSFVLRKEAAGALALAARLADRASGRALEVWTTEPGVHFYSGNFLDGTQGRGYPKRAGACLETQHFPDSPNRPSFPSTLLRPGMRFHSRTVYRFLVEP